MTYLDQPCPYPCGAMTMQEPYTSNYRTFSRCATCGRAAHAAAYDIKGGGVAYRLSVNGRVGGGLVPVPLKLPAELADWVRKQGNQSEYLRKLVLADKKKRAILEQ